MRVVLGDLFVTGWRIKGHFGAQGFNFCRHGDGDLMLVCKGSSSIMFIEMFRQQEQHSRRLLISSLESILISITKPRDRLNYQSVPCPSIVSNNLLGSNLEEVACKGSHLTRFGPVHLAVTTILENF